MAIRLSDFDAVTLDVYGTLIDWEPSIIGFLHEWGRRHGVAAADQDLLMAFDRARADIQKERPAHAYPDVLRRCFDRLSAEFRVAIEPSARETFARSPHEWPAYPDAHAGLVALQRHAKVGALSNIDDASLASSCRKLDFRFDLIVTAERVGAYKPDWPHFHSAIEALGALGIRRDRILHVGQSLRADITPANRLGLKCAWINRPGRALGLSGEGAGEAKPDLTVASLTELIRAIT
ncbi:MAG TPA: HAD family hydrolase [Xanthobacteraceae bacterium]|nr:HAD family hydrolase [Xanthobacteraceae bacterium]